jgi:hypothetical protein
VWGIYMCMGCVYKDLLRMPVVHMMIYFHVLRGFKASSLVLWVVFYLPKGQSKFVNNLCNSCCDCCPCWIPSKPSLLEARRTLLIHAVHCNLQLCSSYGNHRLCLETLLYILIIMWLSPAVRRIYILGSCSLSNGTS